MSQPASPRKRRRFTFSLRSLFVLVTLCAVIAGVVHWLYIRERPYLYVASNMPHATVYLDGISLGKPPISLMRRDVAALFPNRSARIAPGPLRGTIAEFGVFILTIEKEDGTCPLLWIDGGPKTEPRMSMPYGTSSHVFVGYNNRPWTKCTLYPTDWRNDGSHNVPRGKVYVSQVAQNSPLSLNLHFPREPFVPGRGEIQTLNESATVVLRVWPKRRPDKLMFHHLSIKSDEWRRVADGHQVDLQIAALPAGEYWIQGHVENVEGEYRYQDALLPVWFRITDEGELQAMPSVEDED